MISMGAFLKRRREEKNITQKQLADYLGYSTSQNISNYERDICPVPLHSLAKICKYLGIVEKEVKQIYLNLQAERFEIIFNNKKVKKPKRVLKPARKSRSYVRAGQNLPY